MSMTLSNPSERSMATALAGVPRIDLLANRRLAAAAGARSFDMVRELLRLGRAPGLFAPH